MQKKPQPDMIKKIIPINSKRRKAVKKIAEGLGIISSNQDYSMWVAEQKDKIELYEICELKKTPLISVVVPAFNTPDNYLYPFIYSVVGQLYENWELIIVNASTDNRRRHKVNKCQEIDTRIKVFEKINEGISANTNFGIDKANGEFIAFMDHDDTLSVNALYEVVKVINKNKDAGLIYTDEDKLAEDGGKYLRPHIKPDWSPDLLAYVNYITHLTVIRKRLIEKVGYLDPDKEGAQDYDLILKVTDLNPEIVHIPKTLYHWREAKKSTASDVSNKPYIKKAGERALRDHYIRVDHKPSIKALPDKPGYYKVSFREEAGEPTVIISPFANPKLVKMYCEILSSRGSLNNLRLVAPSYVEGVTNVKESGSEFLKNALELASGGVVIINDFVLPTNHKWAEDVTSYLVQKHVHAVSPLIIRQDQSIEDAGLVVNKQEKIRLFEGYPMGVNTYFGDTDWSRNVDEVSGVVCAVRRDEIKEFLGTCAKNQPIIQTLNNFSRKKGARYNVVLSSSPLEHIRTGQPVGLSRFMNPSLKQEGSDLRFYPDDKQILDALETIYRREVKR